MLPLCGFMVDVHVSVVLDRQHPPLTAINLPLKRVIVNPFPSPLDKYDPLYSAASTLLTLQIGQKYFLPEKSYVTEDRA